MKDCMANKVSHDELNIEGLRITNNSSYSSIMTDLQNMAKKDPSSSLSSIVLDGKKGVKRKLDFDADSSSDEDSTLRRENGKRICMGDFRNRTSSFLDTDSNPFSPIKNRQSVASCRSSVESSSCRRRLFPYSKKTREQELRSPLHQSRNKFKYNEVKLSLMKKFPGVPNSDSARSGLLLNLAFSKYNLPSGAGSDKKSNVSYDFGDHVSVNTTTKKECIQYTSIEKDDMSFSKSPVFTAIKKVKRRLNLEEQESGSHSKETNQVCGKERTPSKNSDRSKFTVNTTASARCLAKKTEHDGPVLADSTNVNQNSIRSVPVPVPSLPTSAKKPPSSTDLFKNSKLRPSLRNKIFNLSTFTADEYNSIMDVDVTDRGCAQVDGGNTWRSINHTFDEGSSSAKDASNQKHKPKYDRIVVRQDLVQRAKKDAERLKRLSNLSSESLNIQRVSRRTSIGRSSLGVTRNNVSRTMCCKLRSQSSFMDAHLRRFLNDCTEMLKRRTESERMLDEDDSSEEGTQLSPVLGSHRSASYNVADESRDAESMTNFDSCRNLSHPVIEDAESQEAQQYKDETEFMIENINSQEDNGKSTHVFDYSFDDDNLSQTEQKENISFVSSSEETNVEKLNHQVEEVITQESELAYTGSNKFQSDGKEPTTQENICESGKKKYTLKKHGVNTLCGRLQMLVNKEKSEARIWEYELSKKEVTSSVDTSVTPNSPMMFCIEKMWKEFSRLVVLCARVDSDPTDEFFKNNLADIGTSISHSVVLITERELFPKYFTQSSIFRIHPPWRILYSAALNLQVIFRPTKVEIISPNGKPRSYSDPTLPLCPRAVEQNHFCYCPNVCDCMLPKQYETVIPCLLSLLSNFNGMTSLKNYVQDDVHTITGIDDLVAMYRLSSTTLHLELEILLIDNDFNGAVFWNIIGLHNRAEICCVLVKDEVENLSLLTSQVKVRFTGVIPWKMIPSRLVPKFVEQLNFKEMDLVSKLNHNDLRIFVLSARYGKLGLLK